MSTGLSGRIVQFIGGLIPLYDHEQVGGIWCARSLVDGTLILPAVDDPEGDENGLVSVLWQGDSSRSSSVIGTMMASIAIAKYVELHAVFEDQRSKSSSEFEMLANHFTVKTGVSLIFDTPEGNSELFVMVSKGLTTLGKDALIELIKAKIGL